MKTRNTKEAKYLDIYPPFISDFFDALSGKCFREADIKFLSVVKINKFVFTGNYITFSLIIPAAVQNPTSIAL